MKAVLRPWKIKTKNSKGRSLTRKSTIKVEVEKTMASIIVFLLPKLSERTPDGKMVRLETNARTVFIRPKTRIETPRLFVM